MMKAVAIFVVLGVSSCVTPVTKKQWQQCEAVCEDRQGVMEACVEFFKGPGCHCQDDTIFWLDEKSH